MSGGNLSYYHFAVPLFGKVVQRVCGLFRIIKYDDTTGNEILDSTLFLFFIFPPLSI